MLHTLMILVMLSNANERYILNLNPWTGLALVIWCANGVLFSMLKYVLLATILDPALLEQGANTAAKAKPDTAPN